MRIPTAIQNLTRELIEYRFVLSWGLSLATGVVLQSLYPINAADPILRLIAIDPSTGPSPTKICYGATRSSSTALPSS
jgi:hypothetical protein